MNERLYYEQKTSLIDRPFLVGIVLTVISFYGIQIVGSLVSVPLIKITGTPFNVENPIINACVIPFALIWLACFRLFLKRYNFKGYFAFARTGLSDLWVCMGIAVLVEVIILIFY